jgi:hypothetical protein
MRGEVTNWIVAPIVIQALLDEVLAVDELMHRHQLYRGHAEQEKMLDGCRVSEAGIRTAQLFRNAGLLHREALDVGFVDDGLVPRDTRRAVFPPVEGFVDDDGLGHPRCRISMRRGQVLVFVVYLVGQDLRPPVDVSVDRLGVGIDEQLDRVEALSLRRPVGTIHSVAVALARTYPREVTMPHEGARLGEGHAQLALLVIEETQLHARRLLGEDREVRPPSVPGGAQRVGDSRPDFHSGAA